MTIQNFNSLSKSIHENNVSKGFWDEKRNMGELFMLIVSELSEALEAHRKGKKANLKEFSLPHNGSVSDDEWFKISFQSCIKDTIEDEMADVAIRLLDYCYYTGFQIDEGYLNSSHMIAAVPDNFGEALMVCNGCIYWLWMIDSRYSEFSTERQASKIIETLSFLLSICDKFGIDLPTHIELKMKYNATRERMHGKAY